MDLKYLTMLLLFDVSIGTDTSTRIANTAHGGNIPWKTKIFNYFYNKNVEQLPDKANNIIKRPLDIKMYKYDTLKNLSFERQPKDFIYLYKKDNIIKKDMLSNYISFGYGHNKQCCFPNTISEFKENCIEHKVIGLGSFGDVYQITTKCCGSIYALKICNSRLSKFISSIGYYDPELYFAKYFQLNPLPHIMKFYHLYFYREKLYIVSELLPHKTLDGPGFLDDYYDEKKLDKYIQGIFIGIACLHKNKIVHGDIKPENIGIDENFNIKIFDFGFSNKLDSGYTCMGQKAGTAFFMPPEYLDFKTLPSYQTDWWAFGVVLYVLVENYYPYGSQGRNMPEICKNLKYHMEKKNFRDFTNDKLSKELKDLIKKLLELDPSKRLGVGDDATNDILNHSYFKGKNYDEIIKTLFKIE